MRYPWNNAESIGIVSDHLRDQTAMYRQLADQRDDPVIKNEMLDLALVCEDVANNIEDRLTGGQAILTIHATLACAAVRWPGWDADVTQMKRPPTKATLGPVVNLVSDCVFVTGADGALMPYDSLVDPIVVMRRIGLGFLTTD